MVYFDADETFLIQEIWFPDFDWNNIDIIKKDNWNSIWMQLSLHMDDRLLRLNPLTKIYWIEEIRDVYLFLFDKLIKIPEYDINYKNHNWSNLITNLKQLWNDELADYVLKVRKENQSNNLEELITNWDFLWIVNYCKNGVLMWNFQEIASGLYNVANQVWQYYNNNELAIKLYRESIKYNEKDSRVYNNLATAYKRLSDYENAIIFYNKALIFDSENPIRYLRPALLYAYLWQNENVEIYLTKYFIIWWDDITLIELCNNTIQWWQELLKLYKTL